VDRAGFNSSDGATHHGIFDVAFASQMPGFEINTPVTYRGLAKSLESAVGKDHPVLIRYFSGEEDRDVIDAFYGEGFDEKISVRCDFSAHQKPKNIIITHGRIASECIRAKRILAERGIDLGIILCEYLAPYDRLAREIDEVIKEASPSAVFFAEEEIKNGGFGMLLSAELKKIGSLDGRAYDILAAEDPFVVRNKGERYLEALRLDAASVAERISELVYKH
jgi:1-deoxy-D-xylulose-5-phosphate synthase